MEWSTLHVAFKSVFRIRIASLRQPWADRQQIRLKCHAAYNDLNKENPGNPSTHHHRSVSDLLKKNCINEKSPPSQNPGYATGRKSSPNWAIDELPRKTRGAGQECPTAVTYFKR